MPAPHVELPPDHCAIRCPDYYRGNGRCDAACDVEECGQRGMTYGAPLKATQPVLA